MLYHESVISCLPSQVRCDTVQHAFGRGGRGPAGGRPHVLEGASGTRQHPSGLERVFKGGGAETDACVVLHIAESDTLLSPSSQQTGFKQTRAAAVFDDNKAARATV